MVVPKLRRISLTNLEFLAEKIYLLWGSMPIKPEGVRYKLWLLSMRLDNRECDHSQDDLIFNTCMSLLDDYQYLFELYVRTVVSGTTLVD